MWVFRFRLKILARKTQAVNENVGFQSHVRIYNTIRKQKGEQKTMQTIHSTIHFTENQRRAVCIVRTQTIHKLYTKLYTERFQGAGFRFHAESAE